MLKKTSAIFILICFLFSCNLSIEQDRKPLIGALSKDGMISSAHPLATKVGIEVLRNGGNAFDATVAVHFALSVAYPRAGNIGGGGFAIFRNAEGVSGSLDFREKAPLKAKRDMYLNDDGEVIDSLSLFGHLAAGVPGSVDGMYTLHQKYGSMSWDSLVMPAIKLARKGVVLTQREADNFNKYQEDFKKLNDRDIIFIHPKGVWQKGDTVKYLEYAETLSRIKDEGRKGFYEGLTADLIVKEMESHGGIISHKDLKNYQSVWRDPVKIQYKDSVTIISMPPPSSGGVALAQLMQGAEDYDLKKFKHNSVDYIHLLVELERRVYADRATFLGDPDFIPVPVDSLVDDDYITRKNADIDFDVKTDSKEIKAGNVEVIESFETSHYSIVDQWGNAVAVTTTLNGFFGCKVMVEGAGFFLNNEMDDFSMKPGVPNQFGLIGGEANAIAPEKRMLSSMTPTLVERNGELLMVLGTPGGSTIITSVFQAMLNVLEFDMSMQEAVNAKKFHSQWLPDEIYLEENGFSDELKSALKNKGHQLDSVSSLGRMDCILKRTDGTYEGASDTFRSDGVARGL